MCNIIRDIAVKNCDGSSETEDNHKSEWKGFCEIFGLVSVGCMLVWIFQARAEFLYAHVHPASAVSGSLHTEYSFISHTWAAPAPAQLSMVVLCQDRAARVNLRERFSDYSFPSTSERTKLRSIIVLFLLFYTSMQTWKLLRVSSLFHVLCQVSRQDWLGHWTSNVLHSAMN